MSNHEHEAWLEQMKEHLYELPQNRLSKSLRRMSTSFLENVSSHMEYEIKRKLNKDDSDFVSVLIKAKEEIKKREILNKDKHMIIDTSDICELAYELTVIECERLSIKVDEEDEHDTIKHTDKAQDIFNKYFDLIESKLIGTE